MVRVRKGLIKCSAKRPGLPSQIRFGLPTRCRTNYSLIMKRRFIANALIGILPLCWAFPASPADAPNRDVPDDNLAYPASLKFDTGSAGTGFLVNSAKGAILVTARHVLYGTNKTYFGWSNLVGSRLTVSLPAKDPKETTATVVLVLLRQLLEKREVLAHTNADVAIFRLASLKQVDEKTGFEPSTAVEVLIKSTSGAIGFSTNNVSRFDEVLVANEVYLYGYPSSLGLSSIPQLDFNSPLVRKGIVAGLNRTSRSIIIDCEVFPGNSGSPVVQVLHTGLGGKKFQLIGVASEFVPFADEFRSARFTAIRHVTLANSGYSVVVPMDFVVELIDQLP